MRGFLCRNLRLELAAALSIALGASAAGVAAENLQPLATQTGLTLETHDLSGHTQAIASVSVTAEDGLPANGTVVITDHGSTLAGAALDAEGKAKIVLSLSAGEHSLAATYSGDATHRGSNSQPEGVQAQTSTAPGFQIAVAPATLTLTPGQSGTVIASVTPENNSSLTAPLFVTLSCSGLPDQAACTFTPENVEILPTTTTAITSSMVVSTQAAGGAASAQSGLNSVTWAILLPGTLGLGCAAWAFRRRTSAHRLSLLALIALVTTLGTTACAPRYDYYHHGPPAPPATPAGTYTVTVTAQSTNGVTATTNSTTIALTVQ